MLDKDRKARMSADYLLISLAVGLLRGIDVSFTQALPGMTIPEYIPSQNGLVTSESEADHRADDIAV